MAAHRYDDGRTVGVSLDRYYGEETVLLELSGEATYANLTSALARAVAKDLLTHADALDELTGKAVHDARVDG